MKLIWCSDVHFNFVDLAAWESWIDQVRSCHGDGLLIGGDISESEDFEHQLERIDRALHLPIYFVLGNHDYYRSSIQRVRNRLRSQLPLHPNWNYLTGSPAVVLNESTALIGHDAWGDAHLGDYEGSWIQLHDFSLIEDLRWLSRQALYERLRELGRNVASTLRPQLWEAADAYEEVIILTHVPPFEEVCLYEGRASDPYWLPFFTCGALGELLLEAADRFPSRRFLVLSGHTHHAARSQIRPNLVAQVAHAEYGKPSIAEVIVR